MRDGELCHDDPITIRAEARIQVNDAEAQSVSRLIGLSPKGRPLTLAMVLDLFAVGTPRRSEDTRQEGALTFFHRGDYRLLPFPRCIVAYAGLATGYRRFALAPGLT